MSKSFVFYKGNFPRDQTLTAYFPSQHHMLTPGGNAEWVCCVLVLPLLYDSPVNHSSFTMGQLSHPWHFLFCSTSTLIWALCASAAKGLRAESCNLSDNHGNQELLLYVYFPYHQSLVSLCDGHTLQTTSIQDIFIRLRHSNTSMSKWFAVAF